MGEGDCDSDSDCEGSLVCGRDNCKNFWPRANKWADCCIKRNPPKVEAVVAEEEDEDEEIFVAPVVADEDDEIADATTENILSSPGYDGKTKYDKELDQEKTFEAGPGKHVLLQFNKIDIEEGRQYEGCIYDWVEVRSNKTAITEKAGDKYCGTKLPSEPILSKGKEMSVVFHSDRVNEGTGFNATLFEVSKVEEDSFVENYENWGPTFRISFDLMILKKVDELQSIFAFLGRHFANVPQILLNGRTLRFTRSYPLTGKKTVKYEAEVDINTWVKILIETKLEPDNTFDFVISVGGEENTVEDVSAKALEDVTVWDTHYALKPATAVYKNLVIDPTTSSTDNPENRVALPHLEDDIEPEEEDGPGFFIPFEGFEDWNKAQKPVYTVVY